MLKLSIPLLTLGVAVVSSLSAKYTYTSVLDIFGLDDEIVKRVEVAQGLDAGPPPHTQVARMARYVVHQSNWAALATHCSRAPIEGYPFANVFSVSDGASVSEASGTPYFYLTPLEISVKDLTKDNRASMTMSLAQGTYCDRKRLDPEDPRCAHVILTGHMVKVPRNSKEEKFAKKSLFSRHPEMSEWPQDHDWFYAKMNISNIQVLDFFGGAKSVPVEQYYQATPY